MCSHFRRILTTFDSCNKHAKMRACRCKMQQQHAKTRVCSSMAAKKHTQKHLLSDAKDNNTQKQVPSAFQHLWPLLRQARTARVTPERLKGPQRGSPGWPKHAKTHVFRKHQPQKHTKTRAFPHSWAHLDGPRRPKVTKGWPLGPLLECRIRILPKSGRVAGDNIYI